MLIIDDDLGYKEFYYSYVVDYGIVYVLPPLSLLF